MLHSPPLDLAVEVRGTGFPILCLHGHPGSGAALRVFTEVLSQNYRTIAPDLRGYGKSRVQQPFVMADHLTDLEHLLAQQEVEQCLLLGWSLGGILAMELALRNPARYPAIALVATAARPRGAHPRVSALDLVHTGIATLLNQLRPGWPWAIETFGTRSLFRWLIHQPQSLPYRYLAQSGVSAYLNTSRWANQALQTSLSQGYNRLDDLAALTMPCVMIAGEHDVHITAASNQETAQRLPNCEWHCVTDTAHLLPWEQPEVVVGRIHKWFNDIHARV
ncbi:MAG: alpha/beta hydrolase [Spirulina sp. SIO3F2]|nr:alpha/beta hydrolase [Spirulina sp. SIO3F2]